MKHPLLLLCVPVALALDPVESIWIRASASGGSARPEVHSVEVGAREVVVRSAGVSLVYFGPLQARPEAPPREFVFHIPRTAPRIPPAESDWAQDGMVGVFATGVPIFGPQARPSFEDRRLWHFDSMRGSPVPPVVRNLLDDGSRHSPILGYTLRGSPIYGPWARIDGALRAMRSSYRLRSIERRSRWPDGLELTPGQAGPSVDADAPLGTFAEDYEFVAGSGDLDRHNGRFAHTPEYPDGVYAHFLSVDQHGGLAFPYLVGGRMGQAAFASTEFARVGDQIEWTFRDASGVALRQLEWVHERPLHLMVVSDNFAEFAHIHPERHGDSYRVEHRFPTGGRHHLWADFSPPGSPPRVEHRVVEVAGPKPRPRAAPPALGKPVEAGVDAEFALPFEGDEPYLGAWGHFVFVGEDHRTFIHAHPRDGTAIHDHTRPAGPPPESVRFTANFPRPGRYRLWAQFQREGKPLVRAFRIEVKPGRTARVAIPAGAVRVNITSAGFDPARVTGGNGGATIAFARSAEPNCGDRVVIPSLGIERRLPPGGVAVVKIPLKPGEGVRFSCGMGMYRGVVVGSVESVR
jgi:hypothetical protein